MEHRKPKRITGPEELTRSQRQYLQSLHQKKYRYQHRQFLIEGIKPVAEALEASCPIERIFVAESVSGKIPQLRKIDPHMIVSISDSVLSSISSLQHPEGIIAVANIPDNNELNLSLSTPFIYLWEINDPGNLGTIFRTARWFGVSSILLSPNSVDPFSPKVVRSSMGAIFHVHVFQNVEFAELTTQCSKHSATLYAAVPGAPPLQKKLANNWGLILGSESHGIPDLIMNAEIVPIGIPRYGSGESLNVSVSGGILIYDLIKSKRG